MEKETRTFQLSFDEKQISVLVAGLHELPGNLCMPLLGSIQKQIAQQIESDNKPEKKTRTMNGSSLRKSG